MAFTYREGLGRPLTYQEMDDNLEYVEALAQNSEAMSDSAGTSAAQAATSAGLAADQVSLAEQHADQAAQDAVISQQARDEAVQSAAVVTGAASLTPAPGKIPLADGNGNISADWLDMSASGKTVATGTPAQGRSALGLGTIATQNATNVTLASSTSGQVPLTLSKTSGLGRILEVRKAADAVSYFAIESGTSGRTLLPVFRAFSDYATSPALHLVGDSPADKDTGNTPMVIISGRIANGVVANRPLLQIANLSSVRISVAADGYLRSVAPIRPGAYTVATLPSTADDGAEAYATDGRKAGESAGAGTGVPVYYQGGWRTYYDNSIVTA